MGIYCKAYQLKEVRQFPGWQETQREQEEQLTDETVCYIWDDFTVVKSPFHPESTLFDQVTPEWQAFCKIHLQFEIPDDLRYAYEEKTS